MQHVEIYTDGACKGNPGVGGWGVFLRYGQHTKTLKGAVPFTTNNRMELMAAIEALKLLKRPCSVNLYTDSSYVQKGISEWLPSWKRKNWKTAKGNDVKNVDLWQQLDLLAHQHQIHWHWIKGHAGNVGNELVDMLANQAIAEFHH